MVRVAAGDSLTTASLVCRPFKKPGAKGVNFWLGGHENHLTYLDNSRQLGYVLGQRRVAGQLKNNV
jgi:hypothetical protein